MAETMPMILQLSLFENDLPLITSQINCSKITKT